MKCFGAGTCAIGEVAHRPDANGRCCGGFRVLRAGVFALSRDAAAGQPGGMTRTVLCLFAASLIVSSVAQAQPGVFVDPDTPAGTEYKIPLEEARRQGAGDAQRRGGDGRTGPSGQPLFGVGIERVAAGSAGGGGSAGAGGSAGESGDGLNGAREPDADGRGEGKTANNATNGRREETTRGRPSPLAVEARAGGGGSETLVSIAIAAAVLAVGLVGGFGLRRLLRSD
jgi:hypothetical protein